MQLRDYIRQGGRGATGRLAAAIGACGPMFTHLAADKRVNINHCIAIERATCGQVTRADLRPHDWQQIWPEYQPPAAGAAPPPFEGPIEPLRGKAQPARASTKPRTRRAIDRAAAKAAAAREAKKQQEAAWLAPQ